MTVKHPSGFFATYMALPVIIDAPGLCLTRCGETVYIFRVSEKHDHDCRGAYESGRRDGWHKSGRLYFSTISQNDIVSKKPIRVSGPEMQNISVRTKEGQVIKEALRQELRSISSADYSDIEARALAQMKEKQP